MSNQEPQVEVQHPDAEAQAQQQEAFNIGLDLQLRVKALEFAKEIMIAAGSHGFDVQSVQPLAGAAFSFLKDGPDTISAAPAPGSEDKLLMAHGISTDVLATIPMPNRAEFVANEILATMRTMPSFIVTPGDTVAVKMTLQKGQPPVDKPQDPA